MFSRQQNELHGLTQAFDFVYVTSTNYFTFLEGSGIYKEDYHALLLVQEQSGPPLFAGPSIGEYGVPH